MDIVPKVNRDNSDRLTLRWVLHLLLQEAILDLQDFLISRSIGTEG